MKSYILSTNLQIFIASIVLIIACGEDQNSAADQPENSQEQQTIDEADRPAPPEEEMVELDPELVKSNIRDALDDAGRLHVLNRSPEEIEYELGEPIALIRQGYREEGRSKEAMVYQMYDQDATGLYIFFERGVSVDYRLDSFHGVYGSALEAWFRPE